MAKVLLVGSGAREHAIAWKLSQSAKVQRIFVVGGNAGTSSLRNCTNVDIDVNSFSALSSFCDINSVDTLIVGPEQPLANGLVDHFVDKASCVRCFGPTAKAAQIESSKVFAKKFMSEHGIPTARYAVFRDYETAVQHIKTADYKAFVVKASGLAAGKGVYVAKDVEEACAAVADCLIKKKFGSAGEEVLVEELLEGAEVSAMCFTDGSVISMMPFSQDYKRLNDFDQGPNTGGMGAICPYLHLKERETEFIKQGIMQKVIDGLKSRGIIYKGVLYAGLMFTEEGMKVLEFNCRFGDPECEVVLPLLRTDLYDICYNCAKGSLRSVEISWATNEFACATMMISKGYPGHYEIGYPIVGLQGSVEWQERHEETIEFHSGTVNDGDIVRTNGGRVLCVVGVSDNPTAARRASLRAVEHIHFQDCFYRRDIGSHLSLRTASSSVFSAYAHAGVDIVAGNKLVESIRRISADTLRPGFFSDSIGGFAACFDLKAAKYLDPILVSGADGVGTKLKVAIECKQFDGIGVDLVAMCANDILTLGAEPLFFLDYFASGKLDTETTLSVIRSIKNGCILAGCSLVGGETAEMPGMYSNSDFDLAGFVVGALERTHPSMPMIDKIVPGDILIAVRSSGVHSNGFSLVREIVSKANLTYSDPCPWSPTETLGSFLLTPTQIYVKVLLPLFRSGVVKAAAHITGGGLIDNLPRVLPNDCTAEIDTLSWRIPDVFRWLKSEGDVSAEEMFRVFNCGLGMVLVVGLESLPNVKDHFRLFGKDFLVVGSVRPAHGGPLVKLLNVQRAFSFEPIPRGIRTLTPKKRVAVLISGSGTNLKCLIEYSRRASSRYTVVCVICNIPNAGGIKIAEDAGIQCQVVPHKKRSREEFESDIDVILKENNVDIVCLAGFMRILTEGFVNAWAGKLLNIHPALLPSFKGCNAQQQALDAGVRVSGCTVHFVSPEVDAGEIILQESVPVYPNDTVDILTERIKAVEHCIFPKAVNLVANGTVCRNPAGGIIWKELSPRSVQQELPIS